MNNLEKPSNRVPNRGSSRGHWGFAAWRLPPQTPRPTFIKTNEILKNILTISHFWYITFYVSKMTVGHKMK